MSKEAEEWGVRFISEMRAIFQGEGDAPDDPLFDRMLKELSYAKSDDRLMVLTAHGLVERVLKYTIKHRVMKGSGLTHAAKLQLANAEGVMPNSSYEELDWFRRLRNKAAHEPYFSLTDEERAHLTENEYFGLELISLTYPDGKAKPEDLLFYYSFFSIFAAFCISEDARSPDADVPG